jgi:hypothetical protein
MLIVILYFFAYQFLLNQQLLAMDALFCDPGVIVRKT